LVSEKHNTVEISDAEKKELIMKVYPRLKKKAKIIRFFKLTNAVLLLLFMTSCATTSDNLEYKEKLQEQLVSMQIKQGLTQGEIPSDFEKDMPESDITLASVIRFSKEPTVKQIATDVEDLDYDGGILVLLKKDRLETNHIDCPYISIAEDNYLSVRLEDGLAVVTGSETAYLLDVVKCGIIYETSSKGKGFSLSDKYMLEFTPYGFELFDSRHTRKLQSGNFLGAVRIGDISGNSVMFANENGKVALMNTVTGKFSAIYPESIDIKEAYFEDNNVYILNAENELMRLAANFVSGKLELAEKIQAKEGCFFLKRNGRLFCDKYVYGLDIAYRSPVDGQQGLVRDGLIFLIDEGVVNFVDVERTYKKAVLFRSSSKKLCLNEGLAYFTDLDGSVKYISAKGAEKKAAEMPANCDHRFDFEKGALKTPDGSEIYRFAEIVNQSEKAIMLKRVIDEDVYYYFEPLVD